MDSIVAKTSVRGRISTGCHLSWAIGLPLNHSRRSSPRGRAILWTASCARRTSSGASAGRLPVRAVGYDALSWVDRVIYYHRARG